MDANFSLLESRISSLPEESVLRKFVECVLSIRDNSKHVAANLKPDENLAVLLGLTGSGLYFLIICYVYIHGQKIK
jgi:hypothetical protein